MQTRADNKPSVVSDLICEGEWRADLLSSHFLDWEVEEILKIPIARYGGEDVWTWHFTKNGEFSVRSAYHVELKASLESRASSSGAENSTVWNRLWKANIPPKIKLFGWRVLHESIAVRSSLSMRGMSVDSTCPCCGTEPETILHSLFLCQEARLV
uniref:Reverse transcriptase zinc-binding domain-containing protein n=1 Tax=Chenopodium quinoa TaxID=63459 RepID=A0A803LRA3_CHEQI